MPPKRSDILKLCELLAEQEHLKLAIKESLAGGMYAFAGAVIGGLVGGPVGMGAGGCVGSVVGACRAKKFKSVVEIIQQDMSEKQKSELADCFVRVIQGIDATDVYTIMTILAGSPDLKNLAVQTIMKYLTSQMSYQLT